MIPSFCTKMFNFLLCDEGSQEGSPPTPPRLPAPGTGSVAAKSPHYQATPAFPSRDQ